MDVSSLFYSDEENRVFVFAIIDNIMTPPPLLYHHYMNHLFLMQQKMFKRTQINV